MLAKKNLNQQTILEYQDKLYGLSCFKIKQDIVFQKTEHQNKEKILQYQLQKEQLMEEFNKSTSQFKEQLKEIGEKNNELEKENKQLSQEKQQLYQEKEKITNQYEQVAECKFCNVINSQFYFTPCHHQFVCIDCFNKNYQNVQQCDCYKCGQAFNISDLTFAYID